MAALILVSPQTLVPVSSAQAVQAEPSVVGRFIENCSKIEIKSSAWDPSYKVRVRWYESADAEGADLGTADVPVNSTQVIDVDKVTRGMSFRVVDGDGRSVGLSEQAAACVRVNTPTLQVEATCKTVSATLIKFGTYYQTTTILERDGVEISRRVSNGDVTLDFPVTDPGVYTVRTYFTDVPNATSGIRTQEVTVAACPTPTVTATETVTDTVTETEIVTETQTSVVPTTVTDTSVVPTTVTDTSVVPTTVTDTETATETLTETQTLTATVTDVQDNPVGTTVTVTESSCEPTTVTVTSSVPTTVTETSSASATSPVPTTTGDVDTGAVIGSAGLGSSMGDLIGFGSSGSGSSGSLDGSVTPAGSTGTGSGAAGPGSLIGVGLGALAIGSVAYLGYLISTGAIVLPTIPGIDLGSLRLPPLASDRDPSVTQAPGPSVDNGRG